MKPTLSSKARNFLKSQPDHLQDTCFLYLCSKVWKLETICFQDVPESWQKFPKGHVFKENIPESFFEEWTNLWPTKGQAQAQGFDIDYPPRQALAANRKKLTEFINAFDKNLKAVLPEGGVALDDKLQDIMKATINYFEDARMRGFIKKSTKFVKDINSSMLEDWCRKLYEEEEERAGNIGSMVSF